MKHYMSSAEKISMYQKEAPQFEKQCAKLKDLQQNWSEEEALSTLNLKKEGS